MTYDRQALKEELKRDEGNKRFLYDDNTGEPPALTFMNGRAGKLTGGVGWNFTDNGLPPFIVDQLLDLGIDQAALDVHALLPEWENLSDARQRVLLNLAFNMGRNTLAQFRIFLRAMQDGEFEAAAVALKDSRWFTQVGKDRSDHLLKKIVEG
mgnify:CR=1 FL=1